MQRLSRRALVAGLREAVRRTETGLEAASAERRRVREDDLVPLVVNGDGLSALDGMLGGGLRRGGLHEVVPGSPVDSASASAFALALVAQFMGEGTALWVVEETWRHEDGTPYGPGLAAHGFNPARLVLVNAATGEDVLWVMEEALRAGVLTAVLGEWRGAGGLGSSRRLRLAARRGGTPCILLRAAGTVPASAADTRFAVAARAGEPALELSRRGAPTLPGPPRWVVRLIRTRARSGTGFDPERPFRLRWDMETRCLYDDVAAAPLPVRRPALPFNRSGAAASQGVGLRSRA